MMFVCRIKIGTVSHMCKQFSKYLYSILCYSSNMLPLKLCFVSFYLLWNCLWGQSKWALDSIESIQWSSGFFFHFVSMFNNICLVVGYSYFDFNCFVAGDERPAQKSIEVSTNDFEDLCQFFLYSNCYSIATMKRILKIKNLHSIVFKQWKLPVRPLYVWSL